MRIPPGNRAGTSRDAPDASRRRGVWSEARPQIEADPPRTRCPITLYHIPPPSVCKMRKEGRFGGCGRFIVAKEQKTTNHKRGKFQNPQTDKLQRSL